MFEFTLNQPTPLMIHSTEDIVNPSVLLRAAVLPIAVMGDKANINYSNDFIMMSSVNTDVSAFLVMDSSSILITVAGEENGCIGINPRLFRHILRDHEAFGSLTVGGTVDDGGRMEFHFSRDDPEMEETVFMDLLDEAPYVRIEPCQLQFEVKAIVGIPSSVFLRALALLVLFGLRASVNITHDKVVLSAGTDHRTCMTLEGEECIIRGVAENDHPIEFSFNLQYLTSYIYAARLSNRVWLYIPYWPEDPVLLKCRAATLGSIMFYFNNQSS